MKTANQKASEIRGHLEECPQYRYLTESQRPSPMACACEHPLAVQVAAAQGTLRVEHEWHPSDGGAGYECDRCRKVNGYPFVPDDGSDIGPCYPPLDPAKAWELLRECIEAQDDVGLYLDKEYAIYVAQPPHGLPETVVSHHTGETPELAIARLYVALHDAGLIPSPAVESSSHDRGPDGS